MSQQDDQQENHSPHRGARQKPGSSRRNGGRRAHNPSSGSDDGVPLHRPPKGQHESLRDRFQRFAHATSNAVGSVWAFVIALLIVVVWGFTGPLFGYSDTWQLVINTGTTIVTFIMVFLIQSTQNRDARAMHLKLDELIRAMHGARNDLMNLEELPEEELDALAAQFSSMHKRITDEVEKRQGED